MAKLSAEAKVSLLVLAGSAILLYMTFAVGKYEFGEKKGYIVTATFDSVAGLDTKAAVRMAGVLIGTVEAVELDDSRAKVILRIHPGVKIIRGSEAMVKTMGLLGDKYVDVIPPRGAEQGRRTGERSGFYQDGDRIDLEIVKDHLSDFYQWFYFRLAGGAGRKATLRIVNCEHAAYANGWPGYKAVMSVDRDDWVRIADTDYDDGILDNVPDT